MIYLLGGAVEVANGIPLVISLMRCINLVFRVIVLAEKNRTTFDGFLILYGVKTQKIDLHFRSVFLSF